MKNSALFVSIIVIFGIFASAGAGRAQVPPLPGAPEIPGLPGLGIPPPSQVLWPMTNLTGYNFTSEDINIDVQMNFADIDVDVPGIIFGSGKLRADMDIKIRLELRVISFAMIMGLISGSGGNATENNSDAQNASMWSGVYIPADAFRATLTGDLLALFVAEEEKMVKKWLESSLPDATILSVSLEWDNASITTLATSPDLDPREPPLVILGTASIRYIMYLSAYQMLLESGKQKDYGTPELQKRELQERLAAPMSERGFFGMLAYDFFMVLNATPGWNISITVHLPPSWSFEYVNQKAMYGEKMHTVSFAADAKNLSEGILSAAVLSITNRGMVISYCLIVAAALITVIGLPIRWYQKRRLMKKIDKKIADGLKIKPDAK